jgi:hypothetical protein
VAKHSPCGLNNLRLNCLYHRLRLVNKRLSRLGSDSCKLLDLHSKSLSADELRCVAQAFPNAKEVDLTFSKGLGPNAIAQLQCCSGSLSKLVLRGVGVTDEMLQAVPNFTRLTTLDISQSTPVSFSIVEFTTYTVHQGC